MTHMTEMMVEQETMQMLLAYSLLLSQFSPRGATNAELDKARARPGFVVWITVVTIGFTWSSRAPRTQGRWFEIWVSIMIVFALDAVCRHPLSPAVPP